MEQRRLPPHGAHRPTAWRSRTIAPGSEAVLRARVGRRRLLLGLATTLSLTATLRPRRARAFVYEPVIHAHMAGEMGARSNAYLVETEHGVIAVDALLTVSEARAFRAALDALGKPLLAVLLTHGHPDHYGGLGVLIGQADVPVAATRAVDQALRADRAGKEERLRAALGDQWLGTPVYPNRLLDDGHALTFDGLTFGVHDLGPGESNADSYWTVRPGSAAFVGDVALNQVHAYLADGHSGPWLASLARLETALPSDAVLYPGHGAAGGLELLAWQRGYVETYREAVQTLAQGRTALSDPEKRALSERMEAFLPSDRLQRFIVQSADAVAAELANES